MSERKTEFGIEFDGPAVADGTMDVKDFANSLLALDALVQRANELLNGPDAPPVRLKVKSPSRPPETR